MSSYWRYVMFMQNTYFKKDTGLWKTKQRNNDELQFNNFSDFQAILEMHHMISQINCINSY